MDLIKRDLAYLLLVKKHNGQLSEEEEEKIAIHLYGKEAAAIYMNCFRSHQVKRFNFSPQASRGEYGSYQIDYYIQWTQIRYGDEFSKLVELVLATDQPLTRAQAIQYLSTVEPLGHYPKAIVFSLYAADKYLIDEGEDEYRIQDRLDPDSFEYLEKKYKANLLDRQELSRYIRIKYGERAGYLQEKINELNKEEENELFYLKHGQRALDLELIGKDKRTEKEKIEYRRFVYGEKGLEVYRNHHYRYDRFIGYNKTRMSV